MGNLNNPKRRMKECTLSAERWPNVHQVILLGLDEKITQQILETYFRNEEKSGCCTFVDVTMKGRGVAVVTLQKSHGKSENRVYQDVELYYCCLYIVIY